MAQRIALVTGAGSGIGFATTQLLAESGHIVYAADIALDALDTLSSRYSGQIITAPCDVRDLAQIASLFATITADHGRLDVTVNNAGAPGTNLPLAEMDFEAWDDTMVLLLRSVAAGIHHSVPLMKAAGGGAIVNLASVAAFQSGMAGICYSTAKAGVLHLTRLAASELASAAIRVNSISPGLILSNIFSSAYRDQPAIAAMINAHMRKLAPSAQPLGVAGEPTDAAAAIAFLASDAARFITGTNIMVDGGMTLGPSVGWQSQQRAAFEELMAG